MAKNRELLVAYIPYMMSVGDENVDWIKRSDPQRTAQDRALYDEFWQNYQSPYATERTEDRTEPPLATKAFDPTQPRWPKGLPKSGQWRQVAPSDFDEAVWQGKQQTAGSRKWAKNESGALGEDVAMRVLGEMLGEEFETINDVGNNAPVDIISQNWMIEVKTGLAQSSNMQWRATIGEPGKEEKALLAQMTSEDKLEHNNRKRAAIMVRKQELVDGFSQVRGRKMQAATATLILSPDGKRADVFLFPGFHLRIGWNQKGNEDYYVGTYDTGKK